MPKFTHDMCRRTSKKMVIKLHTATAACLFGFGLFQVAPVYGQVSTRTDNGMRLLFCKITTKVPSPLAVPTYMLCYERYGRVGYFRPRVKM